MKFRNLYFAMAAGLAFTACSGDEPANSGNGTTGDFNYVSVRICTPGEMDSRYTDSDKDYNKGTSAESGVTDAMFVFFGENNNISDIVSNVTFNGDWSNGTSNTVDKFHKTIVQLKGTSITPAKVVCILNPTPGLETLIRQAGNLNGVRGIVANFAVTEANKFVMTNSAYKTSQTGGEYVYATAIDETKIYDSAEAASAADAASIDIYVERIVSRIDLFNNTSAATIDGKKVVIDGTEVAIKPTIEGIELTDVVFNEATLIKNIDDISYEWDWNDATNFRSYWAKSVARPVITYTWNETSGKDFDSFSTYILPNTQAPSLPLGKGQTSKATKVIATATLKDADGNAINLIRYLDTYYKDENDYLTRMAAEMKSLGITYTVTSDEEANRYKTYDPEDLEVVRYKVDGKNHAYKIICGIKADVLATKPLTKADDGENATDAETAYTQFIANLKPAIEWKDGKTYFFCEIEHSGFQKQQHALAGVVRNHIYNVSLESIKGLGTPVYDPSEKIDPERPSEDPETYISAQINVLKWRVVSQSMNLE